MRSIHGNERRIMSLASKRLAAKTLMDSLAGFSSRSSDTSYYSYSGSEDPGYSSHGDQNPDRSRSDSSSRRSKGHAPGFPPGSGEGPAVATATDDSSEITGSLCYTDGINSTSSCNANRSSKALSVPPSPHALSLHNLHCKLPFFILSNLHLFDRKGAGSFDQGSTLTSS